MMKQDLSSTKGRPISANRTLRGHDSGGRCPGFQPIGQELVEFALLVPLLLLVAFGVLDLGRIFHATITITNSCREGARYGMSYPDDISGIILATRREALDSGVDLSSSAIFISCPAGTCDSGNPIRVTVSYTFDLIMGLVFPDPQIQINRYAEMMVP